MKATTTQIAESFAAVIANEANRLEAQLRGKDTARGLTVGLSDKLVPENEVLFVLECLIFVAFPFDVIIGVEFGVYGDVIRKRLRKRLFQLIRDRLEPRVPDERFADFEAAPAARSPHRG